VKHTRRTAVRRGGTAGSLVLGGALLLAACSSSSGTDAGASASSTTAPPVVVKAATVAGFGTVLVDGSGRTLYMLTSEQGGKLTCTDNNGCTKVWPDTELPSGVTSATAGSGIQPSLLGTVKDASGHLYVTYGGLPLYTYSGDSGAGQANGEGIQSFGGTWYVLGVSGQPVTSSGTGTGSGSGPAATTTTTYRY